MVKVENPLNLVEEGETLGHVNVKTWALAHKGVWCDSLGLEEWEIRRTPGRK